MLAALSLDEELQRHFCLDSVSRQPALLSYAARCCLGRPRRPLYECHYGLDFKASTFEQRLAATARWTRDEALRRELDDFTAWVEGVMYLSNAAVRASTLWPLVVAIAPEVEVEPLAPPYKGFAHPKPAPPPKPHSQLRPLFVDEWVAASEPIGQRKWGRLYSLFRTRAEATPLSYVVFTDVWRMCARDEQDGDSLVQQLLSSRVWLAEDDKSRTIREAVAKATAEATWKAEKELAGRETESRKRARLAFRAKR